MREILFRAKTLDDKLKWVEGYYNKIVLYGAEGHEKHIPVISDEDYYWYKINLETLSQFTGLKDKNEVRVFEGDILRISQKGDAFGTYFFPEVPYPCNVVVKWGFCAWMWETITKDKRYISFPDAWCHYSCEVIGNIYDNPELLEG